LSTTAAAADTAPVEVKTVRPDRGDIYRYVTLPATLRADKQVTLYPKVAGYLKSIAVDKGDRVRAGQSLAEIEVPELIAERARYRAEVEVADAAAKRVIAAAEKAPDLVVANSVDEARGRLKIAQANLERTDTLLAYSRILAPFDGTITMRFADPGAFVAAPSAGGTAQNAALFTLMNFDTVRVQIPMPEGESARVRVGQPVSVTIDELPGKTFSGAVSRIGFALDEATRSMLVEADLPNPDGELRPGMYARARTGVEQHANALRLPIDAVLMEKTAASAFVVADGKLKKVPLTVGFNDGRQVEIVKGLPDDEPVVLIGNRTLNPGQPVKVVAGQ
jgi:membrane fusion protein, multidrug efflux system